jgi:signal transduction histidine kinase
VVADVVRRFGSVIDTDIEPGIPVVLADSTYLEQILRNLLTNAAKYGRSGSQIAIRAYMTGDGVVISVANIGDPVAVGDEERIFELFYRAPDTSGAAPGAGVGLFVTRSLATAMGGRVWAERRSDGMTFHLVLEVAPGI